MVEAKSSHPERQTLRLQASHAQDVHAAAALLAAGGLVAIPTETVYGLAANSLNAEAVASIFAAKGRPGWDPLIVHVADQAMLERVVREVPAPAKMLMERFWPGPLTLLLPRHVDLPQAVTAGRDLVGVRMPSHPVAMQVMVASGVPLAAPSANRFGHISPTSAEHVLADLDGRIDAVLDAGPSRIGVESTVFDPVTAVLYRQGGVRAGEIETVLGRAITVYQPAKTETTPESLPSPGVGIRHYAPAATLVLVESERELQERLTRFDPASTAVLLPADWHVEWSGKKLMWERWDDTAGLARTLYGRLRALDAEGVQTIVCPVPSAGDEPLVEAIRDRLHKAARKA